MLNCKVRVAEWLTEILRNSVLGLSLLQGLLYSLQSSPLSADSLIMAESAFPHETRPHPRE